jgi:type I restriction enzyme, S subunit
VRSLRSSLSSWNTGRIGDLPITIIDGDRSAKYPKRDEFQSEGILFLNTTNIVDDRFDLHSANFVSLEKYDSISKGRLQPLDIVMTTRGTIGKVALYDRPDPGLVNAQMLILRADGEIVDPKFLFHMIRSDEFQSKLRNFSSGSAQPQIPITDLRAVTISLPDIHSQRSIAEILSAYDNLIENNTRRIKILEQIAQMLYREWFVDFRFPGCEKVKMVESELAPIPQGWEIKCIQDFGQVITGKTPPKEQAEFFGREVPFIKLPDMHGNMFLLNTSECLSSLGQTYQSSKTLPPNSICVSCIGTAGIVAITTRPSQTNQQINSVVLARLSDREFLYFRLVDLKQTMNQYGSNGATMGST